MHYRLTVHETNIKNLINDIHFVKHNEKLYKWNAVTCIERVKSYFRRVTEQWVYYSGVRCEGWVGHSQIAGHLAYYGGIGGQLAYYSGMEGHSGLIILEWCGKTMGLL